MLNLLHSCSISSRDGITDCVQSMDSEDLENHFGVTFNQKKNLLRKVPGRNNFIGSIKNGIIDLFLLSAKIHEEEDSFIEDDCEIYQTLHENEILIQKKCDYKANYSESIPINNTKLEAIKMTYRQQGRNIERSEKRIIASKTPFERNIGVTVASLSNLDFVEILDKNAQVFEIGTMSDDNDGHESDEEANKSEIHQCLVKVQKEGPTSSDGSSAMTKLISNLEIIKLSTFETLLQKYKSKKVFKYFVEACSAVQNLEIFSNIVPFLSKLKQKTLLGNVMEN